MTPAPPPSRIRAHRQAGGLELEWPGAPPVEVPFHTVRARCPCASCVDEFTGARILDPTTIPSEIAPISMSFTGNYALKIVWTDGHSTGLYTWDLLAELARDSKERQN
ncbi:MAG: DUF971 domain-containing protein [Planctomycetaceae bacterium]|nr:DUF971 domain-containing protein [Planctomycetaceae bacterium]